MSVHFYKAGDHVAIMPTAHSSTDSVMEIAKVERVDEGMVYLAGGRSYERWSGTGLTTQSLGFMVPATIDHRNALAERQMATH